MSFKNSFNKSNSRVNKFCLALYRCILATSVCMSHNVPVTTITICMYFLQTACLVFNPIMVEIKVMRHSSGAL